MGTRRCARSPRRRFGKCGGRSGDARVDSLLKSGIRRMDDGQMAPAVEDFTRIIELRPDFAEGWNKRATAYYLMGDYEQSLKDCDEVVKRNPHHFGALSGYGLIYVQRGELERALEYFERALEVNPNMPGVEQSIELIRYRLRQIGQGVDLISKLHTCSLSKSCNTEGTEDYGGRRRTVGVRVERDVPQIHAFTWARCPLPNPVSQFIAFPPCPPRSPS